MTMTIHPKLESVAKKTGGVARLLTPEGMLWTNGHIALYADLPADREDFAKLGATWADVRDRRDDEAAAWKTVKENGHIYRELVARSGKVWIDEAYYRILATDGAIPYITKSTECIAFRTADRMIAIAMPVRLVSGNADEVFSPSDDLVFGPFACVENDFCETDPAQALKRLYLALEEARRKARNAHERMKEEHEEMESYQIEESDIQKRIDLLRWPQEGRK